MYVHKGMMERAMSDPAIKNAIEQRDVLAKEINELSQRVDDLRRKLSKIDDFISTWEEFAGNKAQPDAQTGKILNTSRTTREKRVRPVNPPKERVGDYVEAFLKEIGRPASRREVSDELKKRGIILQGTDPDMVLSTMLWRMKHRFQR